MKKILYISGTRADYGLMRQALVRMRSCPRLKIELAVTGMHLMPQFGMTINEIRKDKFKMHILKAVYQDDEMASAVGFLSKLTLKLTKVIECIRPDMLLLLGDRPEMLAAAIIGTYLMIPVVHIHGGELTSTVDEIARHAITKLSHVHLTATHKAAERVIRMGEDPWRVHTVGAPGLEDILHEKLISPKDIAKKYSLDLFRPFLLVVQHPVSIYNRQTSNHIRETMEAIREMGYQTIVIYPNADSGGREIIKVIEKYRKYPFIQIYKSISHKEYLGLMKVAGVMIGNSSSGIIEAPSFHLPVVNIGTRQKDRERAENIIDVGHDSKEIKKAIKKAIYNTAFKKKVKKCKNPYGDGKASERIVKELCKIKINNKLLQKGMAY